MAYRFANRMKELKSSPLRENASKNMELKDVISFAYGFPPVDVFCKTFLHNIAKKKYTPLRLKFFSDYFGLDRAFLSRKLSPVKLKMCA